MKDVLLKLEKNIEIAKNTYLWELSGDISDIAASGQFAADRSIEEYAQRIWNLQKMPKRS